MTLKELEELAKTQWEGCHHCDENDKYFWMNGFVMGYLNAKVDNLNDRSDNLKAQINNLDDQIEERRNKIVDMLINNK